MINTKMIRPGQQKARHHCRALFKTYFYKLFFQVCKNGQNSSHRNSNRGDLP